MSQNILNNNSNEIDSLLYKANFYDFMLFGGSGDEMLKEDVDNLTIADFSEWNIENGKLYSTKVWENAVNDGAVLNHIGITGVDNGFIKFDKNNIGVEEFNQLYYDSSYEIPANDKRLFLSPVSDNNEAYVYETEIATDENDGKKYLVCKGGFYQGFYKLHGFNYQTLPNGLENTMTLHFEVRPRWPYCEHYPVLTDDYFENNILFFMGTRAENKFWPFYNIGENIEQDVINGDAEAAGSHIDEVSTENVFSLGETEFANARALESYLDDYGNQIFVTDNKFIFFNQTDTGYTTNNYIEFKDRHQTIRTNKKVFPTENYFLLLNRTETGYTIDTIDAYNQAHQKDYNIYNDVKDNAFAIFILEDGSIGYKLAATNCDNENKYEVIKEKSQIGIVKRDEWNDINVRLALIDENTMKLMFYVNGNLVLVSKELKPLLFRALNDSPENQEGVPYNISIGGGALGLSQTILPKYYRTKDYILPIERDFCGCFIGDIKSFKIINGYVPYSSMKAYL